MANQPPPVLRIGYRMERGDFVALCVALQTKPLSRTLLEIAILLVAVLVIMVIVAGFNIDVVLRILQSIAGLNAPWWLYAALILGPLLALLHPQYVALLAALTYRRNATADKDVTLSFDGTGVTATSPNFHSQLNWDAFIRLIETPTHAFIAISRREALIVPRRAFVDEHDHRMLMGFIRARLAANVGPGSKGKGPAA